MTSLDRFVPFAAILASALAACASPTAQSNTLDPPMDRARATEAASPGSGEIVETPVAPPMASAAPAPATPEAKAAAPTTSAPAVNAAGERLLYDFSTKSTLSWLEPEQSECSRLLQRFPHPHAAPGAKCDPNQPGTPPAQRAGGILLPRVTMVKGAFTRAGATQSAYFIDYCPTGVGVPRTKRLLVLEGEAVELDHEFGGDSRAEEILHAADVNDDGIAEVLLTGYVFRPDRSYTEAVLMQSRPGKPRTLATFKALVHCAPQNDEWTGRRIFFRVKGGAAIFREQAVTERCFYPPSHP